MRRIALPFALIAITIGYSQRGFGEDTKPLKALMITGGGFHDYENQKKILADGISVRANVEWTVLLENPKPNEMPKVYENQDWAKGYDVILHNECYAKYSEAAEIDRIVQNHLDAGVASVMIHCAMHTFRDTETKAWDNLVGVESRRHGAKWPIVVRNMAPEHAVMKGLPRSWTTPQGELYHTSILPSAEALGVGFKADEEEKTQQVCVWANTYKNVRTFATTLGHHNETMQESIYLDLVTRGLLWACNKLNDDGTPMEGYGKTAQVRPTKFEVLLADGTSARFDSANELAAANIELPESNCCGQ